MEYSVWTPPLTADQHAAILYLPIDLGGALTSE
jgi:hypothetical protein